LLRDTAFIAGEFVRPLFKDRLAIPNPAKTSDILVSARCGSLDVGNAVAAAKEVFPYWSKTSPQERGALLRRASDELRRRKPVMAALESLNTGKTFPEALGDIDECIRTFDYSAKLTEDLTPDVVEQVQPVPDEDLAGSIRKEPIGVVGGICPWNYPAMMAAWKIGPALAAGCPIVIKTSEFSPFSTLEMADAFRAAGLPPGCLSVLPGDKDAGASLVAHPDVSKVTFTGSLAAGVHVMQSAANRVNPVTLELGGKSRRCGRHQRELSDGWCAGKSPAVLFEDADVDSAMEWLLFGAFWNCGQICSATSRILVHESIADRVTEQLVVSAPFVGAVLRASM
jgi:betaine-aldehyde dehydrogenase